MTEDQARGLALSLTRIFEVLKTNFQDVNPRFFAEGAFMLLMVNLNDVLRGLSAAELRVNFNDDLTKGDVTDLIANVRNAICHVGSPQRHVDENSNSLSFCVMVGAGVLAKINDIEIGNPYQDDVAFFYGKYRVLLKRHIHKAFVEATKRLKDKANTENWQGVTFFLNDIKIAAH